MKRQLLMTIVMLLLAVSIGEARVAVVGNLTHDRNAKPGESYDGVILCRNDGDTPNEVRAYQTDYLFYSDGRNAYGEPGKLPRSNATWISISPMRLTVAPHETATINYTVTVPEDKSLQGTYWSMIMVEPLAESSPEVAPPDKKKIQVGLQTIVRYGIQIATTTGEKSESKLRFLDKRLSGDGGKIAFLLDLENTGDRFLSPQVSVELYNRNGAFVGRFEGSKLRIYPGCSVRHSVDLTGIPKGDYKALVVADNGDENVFGAEYTISIK